LGIDGVTTYLSSWELLALARYFDIIGPISGNPSLYIYNGFQVDYEDIDFRTIEGIKNLKIDQISKHPDYDAELPSVIDVSSYRGLKISEYEMLFSQFQRVWPLPERDVNYYYADYTEIDFGLESSVRALKERLSREMEYYHVNNPEFLRVENVPRDGYLNDTEFTMLSKFFKKVAPITCLGTKGTNQLYADISDFDIYSRQSALELKERLIGALAGYSSEIPNVINIKGLPVPGMVLGSAEYEHIQTLFDGINFEDEMPPTRL